MFDLFIENINTLAPLNITDIDHIKDCSKIQSYKRGENIITEGDVVRNVYFVLDGCIRLFYNVEGKDKTAFFYNEGSFIWDCKSLNTGCSPHKNLQAVEDVTVVKIGKFALMKLQKLSSNFETLIAKGKEQELIIHQNLLAQFVTLSPEERFLKLMETNKSLFQRVPQQYIASYLGVSAESLCRIKKRVYSKKRELLKSA